jgi:uncharacterized DUF497 family protein
MRTTVRVFEWNEAKAASNVARHGVSFKQAQTAFLDPLAGVRRDPDHSEDEEREVLVGASSNGTLLLVSFTQDGDIIRIISARELTRSERKYYEEERVI